MPEYLVYRRAEGLLAKRNRPGKSKMKGIPYRIVARKKSEAIKEAEEIIRKFQQMQVEAAGSTVSQSTQNETAESKPGDEEYSTSTTSTTTTTLSPEEEIHG
jgi:hypothetical protein